MYIYIQYYICVYIYIYGLLSKSSTVVVSFFHFVSSSKKAKTKKTTNFASVFLVFFRFGALQIWSLPGSFTLWKRLAHISCPQSSLCRTHIFPGCFLKRSIEQRGGGKLRYLSELNPAHRCFCLFRPNCSKVFGIKSLVIFLEAETCCVSRPQICLGIVQRGGPMGQRLTPTEEFGSSISRNHLWNDLSGRWWLQEFPPRNAMKSLRWRKGAYLQHERAGDTPLFSLICSCLGGLARGRCTRFQVFFARLIIPIFSQYPEQTLKKGI